MTSYFVTRHRGAVEWARACGIEAEHLEHLDPAILQPGDVVLGTLPVAVVAEVCLRDARYMHLTFGHTTTNARQGTDCRGYGRVWGKA